MRIALAKLLLGRPTLLLLDEPTNHLDLDARNWLEEYLVAYPHAVILVSHDRFFLDAVVTRIADISLRTITDYVGTYSQYLVERDARLERLRKAKHEQDDEIARMRAFIDRFRYQATKAAQVQSRIKMLDKIVPIEVPPERKRVHFTFPVVPEERPDGARARPTSARRTARNVVFDQHQPAHRARRSHRARRAQRRGQVDADADARRAPKRPTAARGAKAIRSSCSTSRRTKPTVSIRRRPSTRRWKRTRRSAMVPMIRNILGGFLFSGDDIYKKAGVLSGGERTRLAVARMLLRPANTLLLDEPTNHLDLDSKDVLLEALEDFGGTLIFVSHDRYFVDRLATKIIEVGHGTHRGLSGHLRAVPVEPDAASRQRRPRTPPRPRSRQAPRPKASPAPARRASRPRRRQAAPQAARQPASERSRRALRREETPDAEAGDATRAADERGAADRRPRRRASPSASRRSRTSKPGWRRPGSTTTATPPKPVIAATRP